MTKAVYRQTIIDPYTGTEKEIKSQTLSELELKIQTQLDRWEEQEKKRQQKRADLEAKAQAEYDSKIAKKDIEDYKKILSHTLTVNDRIQWKTLYKKTSYPPFDFQKAAPTYEQIASELRVPKKSFLEFISPKQRSKRKQLEEEAKRIYHERLQQYDEEKKKSMMEYEAKKREHEEKETEYNRSIDEFKADFEHGDPAAVEKYIRLVLEYSKYPSAVPKEYDVLFEPLSGTIAIDYLLPNPEEIPRIEEYKFVASSKTTKPIEMKPKQFGEFYESILYQIALRTIHEVFESVYTNQVQSVVFNGWVEGIDRATGREFRSCILSCATSKEPFQEIRLANVEPKECFRNLKGLTAGPLIQLAPVRPVMQIKREDARFIEARSILADVGSIPNLATMDWGDFEHLVRELFEKFFSNNGGEVRVTRASRDWGVDAVVFDPDPIRGGKIVIQAKRYNNVVPVSAVRDLYGTVMNEGAIKGILVTTSYYGHDSREFAKDKPITLIDGSNLIYLFQEHGYNVRIDTKSR